MTTPDEQARTLRGAIERQRAAQDTARQTAVDLARERASSQGTDVDLEVDR